MELRFSGCFHRAPDSVGVGVHRPDADPAVLFQARALLRAGLCEVWREETVEVRDERHPASSSILLWGAHPRLRNRGFLLVGTSSSCDPITCNQSSNKFTVYGQSFPECSRDRGLGDNQSLKPYMHTPKTTCTMRKSFFSVQC